MNTVAVLRCGTGHRERPQTPRRRSLTCTNVVGVTGFEPAASSSRTKRATKLRHTPWQTARIVAQAAKRE